MKYYKTVPKQIKKVQELDYVECDWCFKKWHPDDCEIGEAYKYNQFHCAWTSGTNYPEGFFGRTIFVEICKDCRERFFDLLKKAGIKIQEDDKQDCYDGV